jgi:hypothetical protein
MKTAASLRIALQRRVVGQMKNYQLSKLLISQLIMCHGFKCTGVLISP